ncbi:MAG: HD domain-containing protein [Candidatus Paceibacterota bacterium]
MKKKEYKRIAQHLFEVGTMRKLIRMHRQTLLTDDMSDNIATHSYRVTIIGWYLAKMEDVDPYKVIMMCLLHDMPEVRSGDHNWVHKRYVKIFEEEIKKEQLGNLPFSDLKKFIDEYDERESREAIIAKDADIIDQLCLLQEYIWQGNQEAKEWISGKGEKGKKRNENIERIQSKSGNKLAEAILDEHPSSWWNELWTSKNR